MSAPRQRLVWLAVIGAVAASGALLWPVLSPSPERASSDPHPTNNPLAGWFNSRPAVTVVEASERAASGPGAVKPFNPLDTMAMPTFRADDKGRLVIDVQTRDDIERMAMMFGNDGGLQKVEALGFELPAAARQQLRDLYLNYQQYLQAVSTAIPANQSTLDDARKQAQILHDLRIERFGADQAHAMFGDQEATTDALLKQMSELAKGNPHATTEELAQKAQEAIGQK